jgi:N-acetylglucosamine malate deacetylase 1
MITCTLNKVLFLSAHPDDEYSCSGTLSRFIEEKREIFYAVFAFCKGPFPKGYSINYDKKEVKNSLRILGIKDINSFLFNFQERHLSKHRQEVLDELIILKNKINPDLVLLPALSDIHQDHRTLAEEGLRAFKYSSIFGYESIMNMIASRYLCYVKIGEKHLDTKIKVLECYKSQFSRPYWNSTYIKSLAEIRGTQIGEKYAEAFEVLRLKM